MMSDIYLLRIDTVCSKCSTKNKGSYNLEVDMDVVCCGKCGNILHSPEGLTKKEIKSINECVQKTIEGE
jgi:NMD protein affecting ribosome stability and mRNA decay